MKPLPLPSIGSSRETVPNGSSYGSISSMHTSGGAATSGFRSIWKELAFRSPAEKTTLHRFRPHEPRHLGGRHQVPGQDQGDRTIRCTAPVRRWAARALLPFHGRSWVERELSLDRRRRSRRGPLEPRLHLSHQVSLRRAAPCTAHLPFTRRPLGPTRRSIRSSDSWI